eukprot:GSA120T00024263001.1
MDYKTLLLQLVDRDGGTGNEPERQSQALGRGGQSLDEATTSAATTNNHDNVKSAALHCLDVIHNLAVDSVVTRLVQIFLKYYCVVDESQPSQFLFVGEGGKRSNMISPCCTDTELQKSILTTKIAVEVLRDFSQFEEEFLGFDVDFARFKGADFATRILELFSVAASSSSLSSTGRSAGSGAGSSAETINTLPNACMTLLFQYTTRLETCLTTAENDLQLLYLQSDGHLFEQIKQQTQELQ